jgi:adenylate kinase
MKDEYKERRNVHVKWIEGKRNPELSTRRKKEKRHDRESDGQAEIGEHLILGRTAGSAKSTRPSCQNPITGLV